MTHPNFKEIPKMTISDYLELVSLPVVAFILATGLFCFCVGTLNWIMS